MNLWALIWEARQNTKMLTRLKFVFIVLLSPPVIPVETLVSPSKWTLNLRILGLLKHFLWRSFQVMVQKWVFRRHEWVLVNHARMWLLSWPMILYLWHLENTGRFLSLMLVTLLSKLDANHVTCWKENFNSLNIPKQEYLSLLVTWAQEMGCT